MVKIVKFSCHGRHAPAYGCSLPGDNSGSYVLHDDYAILLARHTALVEAVAWERECIRQLDCAGKFWEDDNIPGRELIEILGAARVEVDRLIA